jgi:hypothetical protein
MEAFQTEFEFVLPMGYVDESGTLHKKGTIRLATAADEILPMKDPRVQQNPSYLTVVLLARVVSRLGNLPMVTTKIIENLFSKDFTYLQDMYNRINQTETNMVPVVCPKCEHGFDLELPGGGE